MEAAMADRRRTADERQAQNRRRRAFTSEFYRQNRGMLALGMGCAVLISAGELGISGLMRQLVDICTTGNMDSLRQAAVLGAALTVGFALVLALNTLAREEKAVSEENERFVDTVKDLLSGFTVIKSFKAEGQAQGLFSRRNREVEGVKRRRRTVEQAVDALASVAGLISQFGVFVLGAWMAVTGRGVTAGMVIVFVQLCNYILSPIGTVPGILAGRKAAMALVDKLAAALADNRRGEGEPLPAGLRDAIRLREVSFAYEEGKPVLRGVNCTFGAGKSYALVGPAAAARARCCPCLRADTMAMPAPSPWTGGNCGKRPPNPCST